MHNHVLNSSQPTFKIGNSCISRTSQKISKIFGRALGQPAPPRPAGPTLFPLAGDNQEWDHGVKKKQWAKGGARERAEAWRAASSGPAGLCYPPMSHHHRSQSIYLHA